MKLYTLALIPLLLVCGCKVKTPENHIAKHNVVANDDEIQDIVKSMSRVSKEDAEIMYKQFGGLAAYMTYTENITTLRELNSIFKRFQEDYGYSRDKYPAYTKAVEQFFLDRNYNDYTDIVTGKSRKQGISRDTVINDMHILAEAARISLMDKK